jgi:tetratricopeptide (TPR) repeat protein
MTIILLLLAGLSFGQDDLTYSQALAKADKIQDPAARVTLYTAAMARFDHDVDRPADLSIAYVGRAYAYNDMKNFNKALEDAFKAEKIDAGEWTVHKAKAYIYNEAHDCDRSTAAYGAAIRLAPQREKASLYREVGLVLRDCSRAYKAAEAALVHAVSLATSGQNLGEMHLGLRAVAGLVCKQGRHEEGLELFRRGLELVDDTGTLYDQAVCLQAAGYPAEAAQACSTVIERMEEDNVGAGYKESHRVEGEGTVKIVAVDTEILPDCYERRGRISKSAADLARACELGRRSACAKKKGKGKG